MALPWPEQFAELKPVLEKDWEIYSIQLQQQFDDGKSGALVYRVDIESKCHRGLAILKLDQVKEWASFTSEKDRYDQAYRDAPDFAATHFPRILAGGEAGEKTALLCSYAADSFTVAQSLSRVEAANTRRRLVTTVVREVLRDWNANYRLGEPIHAAHMLQGWLEYRLWEEQQGRIPEYLEKYGLAGPAVSAAFHVRGRFFPNPYAFSRRPELWEQAEVIPIRGHQHGDLHDNNIFIRLVPNDNEFFLIDLALYTSEQFLFYDTAYLELSVLLRERGAVSSERWLALLDGINCFADGRHVTDDEGLVALARSIQDEEEKWGNEREAGRQDHVYGQRMLARVAAGLNYVNKPASGPVRDLGLLYAAYYLGQFFNRFQINWERTGDEFRPISPGRNAPPPTDAWRAVWEACDRFVRHKNAYVLVASPAMGELSRETIQVIGRVPWAAVLDFDPDGKLLAAVRESRSRAHTVRELHVDQTEYAKLDINYHEATAWLRTNGVRTRPTTIPTTDHDWRRKYQDVITRLARDLHRAVAPRPIIVLFISTGISDYQCQRVYEYLDGVLQKHAEYVFVNEDDSTNIPADENSLIRPCPLPELLRGLAELYGTPTSATALIPKRAAHSRVGIESSHREFISLATEDVEYIREDLELVHRGLADESEQAVADDLQGAFYRGYTITWKELDANIDAQRAQVPKLKDILQNVLARKTHSLSLYHDPGSGGTTVGRRLAWDFKELFPTVLLHRYSSLTAFRIQRLFQRTELPVFVVIEASTISEELREKLYQDLRQTNTRAALLYIQRQHVSEQVRSAKQARDPSKDDSQTKQRPQVLRTPMSATESRDFLNRYTQWCPSERIQLLRDLATKPDWAPYRSPFFFGLVTFEEEFTKVNDYLIAHVNGINESAARCVRFLSLATRYGQLGIPEHVVKSWLNVPYRKKLELDAAAGCGVSAVTVYEGSDPRLKIAHPFLAVAILREILPWNPGLADLCCEFIKELINVTGPESDDSRELLKLMFIDRGRWVGEESGRTKFSELITQVGKESDIGSAEAQHRVLEALTQSCPEEAHFWNHRGRHAIEIMRFARGTSYTEAEGYVQRAIDLDPTNSIHHHSLGMVYCKEIRERRARSRHQWKRDPQETTVALVFGEISKLFADAEACFRRARELQATDEYGYVTQIEMTAHTVIDLQYISGTDTYHEFLTQDQPVSRWCTEKLSEAEELLRELKRLESISSEKYGRRTSTCESKLIQLYDQNAGDMVQALKQMLTRRKGGDQAPVRRMIANACLRRGKGAKSREWDELSQGELKSILHQVQKIFEHGEVTSRDYWLWFEAVRRLGDDFNLLMVLDRLGKWAGAGGTYEAHYYLYVLHFLRCMQGLDRDGKTAQEQIDICKQLIENKRTRRPDDYPDLLAVEPSWCPLVGTRKCGPWKYYEKFEESFVTRTELLQPLVGTILPGFKSQRGSIEFQAIQDVAAGEFDGPTFKAFFAPQQRFLPGRDENAPVVFYLCFSYEGFRARLVDRFDTEGMRQGKVADATAATADSTLPRDNRLSDEAAAEQVSIGSLHTGPVTRVLPYGAFVQIKPTLELLCHISEYENKWIKDGDLNNEVKTGELICGQIIEWPDERGNRRLALSRKTAIEVMGVSAVREAEGRSKEGV